MTKRDKVTVDDIIGIVKCEQTDSVEEVRKLRGRTNERFMIDDAGTLVDMVTRNTYDYVSEVLPLLNEQNNAINELINSEKYWEKKATQRINEITKENEQLKSYIRTLGIGISKIMQSIKDDREEKH